MGLKKYYQELGEKYCIGLFGAMEDIKLQDNSYYNHALYDENLIWMIDNTENKNFAYFFCDKEDFERYLYDSALAEILNNLNQELDENDNPNQLQDKLTKESVINKRQEYISEPFYSKLTKTFDYRYKYNYSQEDTAIKDAKKLEEGEWNMKRMRDEEGKFISF